MTLAQACGTVSSPFSEIKHKEGEMREFSFGQNFHLSVNIPKVFFKSCWVIFWLLLSYAPITTDKIRSDKNTLGW